MGKPAEETAAKKSDENYTSEFDWIQIRQKMEENIQDETFVGKFKRKFSENPLVPAGAFLTLGVLSYGLWNFRQGKSHMSQVMMRWRIAAQGFTVFALVGGMFVAANSATKQGVFMEPPAVK
ncbi:HIG1 domain family member 2A, mitochondrial [Neocloeon triangulifer]|uniref:HIG1 domain family member 2A, mitochondrial n=1 Tax=Neocloeon triangulifer TaxID=2078957 RepID=UPI00286F3F51|nr:HIG1 domain family member 2A, mitochondrial [Neocloeon triangulifer]